MKRTFVYIIILLLAAISVAGEPQGQKARTVELILHPAKAPEPTQRYQLSPKPEEQNSSDAFLLYQKVIQSLPQDYERDKINQWRSIPLKDLPIEQVKATLEKFSAALQLLEQASRSYECNWPPVDPGPATDELMQNLSKYRQLAFVLAVQARLQIAQGQYDQAIVTIRTGLVMARHLSEAPTLIQGMVGVTVGALMCRQLEQLVQAPDAPNLYWALQNLPKPLIDLNKQIEQELANLKKHNLLLRRQFEKQLKPAHDRVRTLTERLNRDVAALQCVEALRLYAATHDGKFPNELTDVTEVALPNDPFTQKPFIYSRTGSIAVLEAPALEGAAAKDAMRYELRLKE